MLHLLLVILKRKPKMTVLSLRLLFFLYWLSLIDFILASQAKVTNNTQNFHYLCDFSNIGNFSANSIYETNLNTLLSTLTSNTKIDYGFYNFSHGQDTNKVNAIGFCRGDVKPDRCRSCLRGAKTNLTLLCPNQKEAIGWYEEELCMLRYSNRSIFGRMENGPAYYVSNMVDATDLDEFNKVVRNLLDGLRTKAASDDTNFKYHAGSTPGPNDQTIYGLVQCTPDLSELQCNDCLVQSIARIPIDCCKNKIGGRVVRPSCNMRFETTYRFYDPTIPPPPSSITTSNSSSSGNSNKTAITIIAIVVPVVVGMVVVLILITICLRLRKPKKKFETLKEKDDDEETDISESLHFNFNTIREATNDFSDSNKLGQGGFGTVYKGMLSNGQEIAVKRLSKSSSQGDVEFKNEVLLVAKLQHRNLVRLFGFCIEGSERLLIYEFVPNKSLDYFIFDQTKRAELDWERRYNIIKGIARGLLYLHEDSRLRIIHRDLKASNILLDEDMNAKIADFGTARLFGVDQTQENTERIVGTIGYMAPEYQMYGQFSLKSDVYSFGVLVLEIVTGKKNHGIGHGENIEHLASIVWRNWRDGSVRNIIDLTLNNDSQSEIMRCIHIGLLCVQENLTDRPTMASVVLMLNSYSVTLAVPPEPAFYLDSRTGNFPNIQSLEYNSEATASSESKTKLAQMSVNEASITDLYPR